MALRVVDLILLIICADCADIHFAPLHLFRTVCAQRNFCCAALKSKPPHDPDEALYRVSTFCRQTSVLPCAAARSMPSPGQPMSCDSWFSRGAAGSSLRPVVLVANHRSGTPHRDTARCFRSELVQFCSRVRLSPPPNGRKVGVPLCCLVWHTRCAHDLPLVRISENRQRDIPDRG